jgi:hypothetical protein
MLLLRVRECRGWPKIRAACFEARKTRLAPRMQGAYGVRAIASETGNGAAGVRDRPSHRRCQPQPLLRVLRLLQARRTTHRGPLTPAVVQSSSHLFALCVGNGLFCSPQKHSAATDSQSAPPFPRGAPAMYRREATRQLQQWARLLRQGAGTAAEGQIGEWGSVGRTWLTRGLHAGGPRPGAPGNATVWKRLVSGQGGGASGQVRAARARARCGACGGGAAPPAGRPPCRPLHPLRGYPCSPRSFSNPRARPWAWGPRRSRAGPSAARQRVSSAPRPQPSAPRPTARSAVAPPLVAAARSPSFRRRCRRCRCRRCRRRCRRCRCCRHCRCCCGP